MSTRSKSKSSTWNMNDYFHGNIRREFIEQRLKEDGDFLLRKNQTGTAIVVSVLWNGKVHHYSPVVKSRSNAKVKYSFGEDEFDSTSELIEHHYKSGEPLPDDYGTMLLNPIRCPKTVYKERDIEMIGKLGEGNFGEVFKVRIISEDYVCAMKTLRDDVQAAERDNFRKEIDMMKTLQHENIVQWIGTVEPSSRSSKHMKILLELANEGALDRLLRKGKVSRRGKLKICMQISHGLAYLHKHCVIHRDLAARNILVHADSETGAIVAKISDFGLSRTDASGAGYELKKAQKLPLKWLAPECFELKRWSMASDVWAFGVLMWEVFTDGRVPYEERNFKPTELLKFVKGGGHPDRPTDCSEEIYVVMLTCWERNPEKRAGIGEIAEKLDEIYRNAKEASKISKR